MSDVNIASRSHGAGVAKIVLIALLLLDAAFIAAHVLLWLQGQLALSPSFNIELDGSFSELFNHLKWIVCTLICLWLFVRTYEPPYLGWTALFAYLFVDDRFTLRENYGRALADIFGWHPAFSLRPEDFGELAVSGIAGVILLGGLAISYMNSSSARTKAFSSELLVAFCVLAFFGVGVDMLHVTLANPTALALAGTFEDGGEMVAGSVLTYLVIKQAVSLYPFALTPHPTHAASN